MITMKTKQLNTIANLLRSDSGNTGAGGGAAAGIYCCQTKRKKKLGFYLRDQLKEGWSNENGIKL